MMRIGAKRRREIETALMAMKVGDRLHVGQGDDWAVVIWEYHREGGLRYQRRWMLHWEPGDVHICIRLEDRQALIDWSLG
jgi:hypothetical protein